MTTAFSVRNVVAAAALAIPTLMVGAQAVLAEALSFTLINESSQDVYYLYVSPSVSDSWGNDVLGDRIVPSGSSELIVIDDGLDVCEYDLLAISPTGDEVEDYGLDLCALDNYTITN